MLKKLELAKKITKRRKKGKYCKTLRFEPGAMSWQSKVLSVTPRKFDESLSEKNLDRPKFCSRKNETNLTCKFLFLRGKNTKKCRKYPLHGYHLALTQGLIYFCHP